MNPTPPDDNDAALQCRLVRAHGRVQGIGYRYACESRARTIGITGWVRNRMDDSVEALLQGTREQLDEMCEWMSDGMPAALVERLDVTPVAPPFVHHSTFERLPTQ
jgi:acylphosphatase